MRMLFTTVPLPGHFFPLVPLAWACRAMGHEVLVATSADFVPEVLRSGLAATAIGPVASVAGLTAGGDPDGLAGRRRGNGRVFARIAAGGLPGALSLVDFWRPDLVVSERAELAGPIAAATYARPAAELHWGVAPLVEYRAAAAELLAPDLSALGLSALPEPALTLNPWPPSLRPPYAAGHRRMRNVPYDGDSRVPGWALRPREVKRVCLTLGTVLPRLGEDGGYETVLPIAERLAALDIEMVIAVDEKIAVKWPALPAAVRHAGRLPLSHVLPACDVAIHHGGQGSALTAIGAGKPQLVLPMLDDQFDNADAVVSAGAGLCLRPEEMTPHGVAEHCLELLHRPGFARAATGLAVEMAAQPALAGLVGELAAVAGNP
ncbi:nucleotide disphospho-sugar-binding domain-containing protein [Actinophytocola sp.]|uniref:nucleotide disphospho-sugar-binding domain-containing protein n=1 Tax=Actinophytocola sp. TaxID=1872138 RepID=UPI002D7F18E0|nr:nucleotide disphospho-sugar-binding domain-containing protein [Actinophytocola sp.]HET9140744.1 nucleotide disphospho-sugar-binding domain-containing protein [Actinophytocola sp.]